jgi:hypothetical protein
MGEKLRGSIGSFISEKENIPDNLRCPVTDLSCAFVKQLFSDLRSLHVDDGSWAVPADIFKVLSSRGLNYIVKDLKIFHQDLLGQLKHAKIGALKDAGYGGQGAHVDFIRHLFASPHREFVPEDAEGSEDESG